MIRYTSNDMEEEKVMIKLELRGKIFIVDRDILMNVKGTYFYGLLSSGECQPNSDGVYVIDRFNEGFDRILNCLSTGKLNCDGLTKYQIECVYQNLDYFLVPFARLWDYRKLTRSSSVNLIVRLQLKDGRLCGSTYDHKICILYKMDINAIEITIEGHKDYINAVIQLEDGRLCSCSQDTTIKIWNIESGDCDVTIGDNYELYCVMQLMDGRLCSCSYDSIEIWSLDLGIRELILTDHCNESCIAQLRNGSICSGGYGGNISIWNAATGVCEMTLSGHVECITAIVIIDEIRICSCSWDKTIRVWDTITGVCERTLEGHTCGVNNMILLLDGRACSVAEDCTVKIWNIETTGLCDLSVNASDSFTKVIQLEDGRLVVSSGEAKICLLGG